MSQLKIAMKKDSMRKNKKLAINICLEKEGLASRLEADQDLGSSREEKERFESERRRDVFEGVRSKAEEVGGSVDEDKAIDVHSSVRDGIMREVDARTGLSGALNLLREQGTFKGEKRKLAAVMDDHEDGRKRDEFKEIQIERRDENGRIMTQKEAYRFLCHGFHGKKPGKRKQQKREKKQEDKSKQMESSDRTAKRIRQVHASLKSPYIVL